MFIEALSKGGSLASSTLAQASNTMQSVANIFDMAGSLALKMNALLEEEEARKTQELLQTQELMHKIQNDYIQNKLDEERIKIDYGDLALRDAKLKQDAEQFEKQYMLDMLDWETRRKQIEEESKYNQARLGIMLSDLNRKWKLVNDEEERRKSLADSIANAMGAVDDEGKVIDPAKYNFIRSLSYDTLTKISESIFSPKTKEYANLVNLNDGRFGIVFKDGSIKIINANDGGSDDVPATMKRLGTNEKKYILEFNAANQSGDIKKIKNIAAAYAMLFNKPMPNSKNEIIYNNAKNYIFPDENHLKDALGGLLSDKTGLFFTKGVGKVDMATLIQKVNDHIRYIAAGSYGSLVPIYATRQLQDKPLKEISSDFFGMKVNVAEGPGSSWFSVDLSDLLERKFGKNWRKVVANRISDVMKDERKRVEIAKILGKYIVNSTMEKSNSRGLSNFFNANNNIDQKMNEKDSRRLFELLFGKSIGNKIVDIDVSKASAFLGSMILLND
jgi:hypothetical protein